MFQKYKSLGLLVTMLLGTTGLANADELSAIKEVEATFDSITADYQAPIPEGKADFVYGNFCKDAELQSIIDYYVIHNDKKQIFVENIPGVLGVENQTTYASFRNYMSARDFPFVNWIYNTIMWQDEPMKFYYLVKGSWAVAPIYNITPDREAKPTSRLVMNIAVGDSFNLFENKDANVPNCDNLNFCPNKLKAFDPYRKVMMITREPDGSCDTILFHAERVDPEYLESNPIYRNEIRFQAPHGNFKFEILHRDWANPEEKISANFTEELSSLTLEGVKYKMVPAENIWNKSTWYLKGKGPYNEKWLYMYPLGDPDKVYTESKSMTDHPATKVVITIFEEMSRSGDGMTKRFVLYPKTNK